MGSKDLLKFLIETVRLNNRWEISYEESKKAITSKPTKAESEG